MFTGLEKKVNFTKIANHLWNIEKSYNKNLIKLCINEHEINNFNCVSMCILCNLKRLHIALSDERKSVNKRNELINQCPHYVNEF